MIAERTLDRLARRFERRVKLDGIFWEHEPLVASASFQEGVPLPSTTDIVVCILWTRLGTRLPGHIQRPDGSTYASGTEFEFEDAIHAAREHGTPDVLVYRKTADRKVSLLDKSEARASLDQKEALDAFIEQWFHGEDGTLVAAFHPFPDVGSFEDLLETHLAKLIEQRLESLGGEGIADARAVTWTEGSPFRGLEVFDQQHAPIFFGRTRAIGDVLDALRVQAAKKSAFVLVLGRSGSGKSSLVRAGVLPLLTEPGVVEGVNLWRRALMRPDDAGGDLIDGLVAALLAEGALPELSTDGSSPVEIAEMIRASPTGISMLLKGALSQAAAAIKPAEDGPAPEARLVFVLDQMEEVFTREGLAAEARDGFFEAVRAMATSGRVWVLATLRSDFYHRCAEVPALSDLRDGEGQYEVVPPTPAELSQIIRRPAEAAGLQFETFGEAEERLDEVLRDEAAVDPASLPLLEFLLEELYKRRTDEGVLTHDAYRQLGGVAGALATRAEEVFAGLGPQVQKAFADVFRLLVTVGEDERATRRRARRAEFPNEAASAFVDSFVEARLLTADNDPDGEPVVYVAHEALLHHWKRLGQWIAQARELLLVRSRVVKAAQRWDDERRRSDLLLSAGKPLEEAQGLLAAGGFGLDERDVAFVAASDTRERKRRRRKQQLGVALVVLAVAAAAGGIVANQLRIKSDESLAEASESLDNELLAQLDVAPARYPEIIERYNRPEYRERSRRLLRATFDDESGTELRRFRAGVALARMGESDPDRRRRIVGVYLGRFEPLRGSQLPRFVPDEMATLQGAFDDLQDDDRIGSLDPSWDTVRVPALSILLSAGRFELLARRLDPVRWTGVRTMFIADLRRWIGDVDRFLSALQDSRIEEHPHALSAVCLALRTVDIDEFWAAEQRAALEARMHDLYRESPSGAVHSAVRAWLHKRYEPEIYMHTVNIPTSESASDVLASHSPAPVPPGQDWYDVVVGPTEDDDTGMVRIPANRLTMVRVPGGTLSRRDIENHGSIENKVPIESFWIASTETTIALYQAYLKEAGKNECSPPLNDDGVWRPEDCVPESNERAFVVGTSRFPASLLCWKDAVRFCNWLSRKEDERLQREGTGFRVEPCYRSDASGEKWTCDFKKNGYRLATEAEWEWACRGGSDGPYCFGWPESPDQLAQYGWVHSIDPNHEVARLLPNAWGLFDMHGNVYEWCFDAYMKYPKQEDLARRTSPWAPNAAEIAALETFPGRVVRSGTENAEEAESGYRDYFQNYRCERRLGFRVARTSVNRRAR